MGEFFQGLVHGDNFLWLMGGTIAIVAISFVTVGNAIRILARERTKREIAAYIAEGTMTPEQGEKLIQADREDD